MRQLECVRCRFRVLLNADGRVSAPSAVVVTQLEPPLPLQIAVRSPLHLSRRRATSSDSTWGFYSTSLWTWDSGLAWAAA